MSTKIYFGQRALDRNPFIVMQRIREVLDPIFLGQFDAAVDTAEANVGKPWTDVFELGRDFARSHPDWDGPIIPERGDSVSRQVWQLMLVLNDWTLVNWSPLDIAYSVSLLPDGRGIEKRPLVLVFSQYLSETMRYALVANGIVEEFGYWNNTDGPYELSAYQWSQRKLAWDKLNVPGQDGLQINHPNEVETVYGLPYRKDPSLRGRWASN